jgi:hypothetical protein
MDTTGVTQAGGAATGAWAQQLSLTPKKNKGKKYIFLSIGLYSSVYDFQRP